MEIIKQDSFNECGICCANMLINYYCHTSGSLKSELLAKCNLTKEGLNLWELEKLCSAYKIELESYQATYDELIESNPKHPFVLVLQTEQGFHYVIGKIFKQNKIKIFDPIGKTFVINNKEEFKEWTGYVCLTKATKFKFKPIDITLPLLKNINFLITILFLSLNIFEFILNITISWLMSKIINLDLSNVTNDSLWKLGMIFLTIIFLNAGFGFINDYLKVNYAKRNNKFFINQFLNQLNNSNYYFYECFTKEQILQHFQLSQQLVSFYNFYWSDFIAQIFLLLGTTTFLIIVNWNLLIMISINITIKLILIFCYLKLDLDLQTELINKQTKANKKIFDFLTHKESNYIVNYEINLSKKISNKLIYLSDYKYTIDSKRNLLDFVINIWQYLFNFVMLIFLWKQQNFNLGTLFLCYSLFNLFNSSLEQTLKTIKQCLQTKPIYQYLLKTFSVDKINIHQGLTLEFPQEIKWNNLILKKNCLIETTNLTEHQLIKNMFMFQNEPYNLMINNLRIDCYDTNDLNKKIILLDNNFTLDKKTTLDNLKILKDEKIKPPLINWNNFNFLKIPKELRIVLILNYLQTYTNCIICFNNVFDNISDKFSQIYLAQLTTLNQHNFIISNTISNQLSNFYDYQI